MGSWRRHELWVEESWVSAPRTPILSGTPEDARSADIYLQPGDRVTIVVDHLGVIDTPIVE